MIDAVNHLSNLDDRFQLDLSRLVILRHSAGGHLALWLASRMNKVHTDDLGKSLVVPIQSVISLVGVERIRELSYRSDTYLYYLRSG
ncbi:hypothetical protein [Metabacillus sediminilitoris]|uniref:hypothetical protein n=1 Tax=Metabacillus sediminilitoris TaxID=2567941 RepID=UPI001454BBA4|nr:hypothetical protein [Metabacillus sediminilitoris]